MMSIMQEEIKQGQLVVFNFVEEGIINTVAEVPSEKVINAVPFYTRIWSTAGTEIKADSVAMGIAESFMTSKGAEISWDGRPELC